MTVALQWTKAALSGPVFGLDDRQAPREGGASQETALSWVCDIMA